MKVNISELKAKLSSYLNRVRRGETVTVLDRKTPIAYVVPVTDDGSRLRVDAALQPPSAIGKVRGVLPLGPVDIDAVLAESRGER